MASAKKTKVVEETGDEPIKARYKGWDLSRIFWGMLLVVVGLLILLDNLNIVEVHFDNLWAYWPLLIVGWGVSMLNIKGTWWSFVSAVLLIGSLGLLAWAAIGMVPTRQVDDGVQGRQVDIGNKVERLDVTVRAGAGNIRVDSRDSDVPVEAVLRSNFTTLKVDSRVDDGTQKVDVSAEGSRVWWNGGLRNDLDLHLTRQLPVSLSVDTGASDLDADLSDVMLERLDIDVGANSSMVKLGDLVDLVEVQISAGASSLTLRVPQESGVSVDLDKGLSSQNVAGLEDRGDGLYETADYDSATKKIAIRGDIGVTSFTLERY